MTLAATTAGPYYATGSIAFSSLRQNFRAQRRKQSSSGSAVFETDNNPISASELRRILVTTGISPTAPTAGVGTSPYVPNATENVGITTYENWKTSQFRNSIKYYYITQSGIDTYFDAGSLSSSNGSSASWNSNLNKNIPKVVFIDGSVYSQNATTPSFTFSSTAYNVIFDVYGNLLGAGGAGGGTATAVSTGIGTISGQPGGTAASISSPSGNNIVVYVRSSAQIFAGGGGGERGEIGAIGSTGTCNLSTTLSGCGGAPGCPGGWSQTGSWGGGCCQTYCQWCGWNSCGCQPCSQNTQYRSCAFSYAQPGGAGGNGGVGGPGRGSNNLSGALTGSTGAPGGPSNGCGSGVGGQGGTGASGGDWASAGGNTNNSGSGGDSGRAISGSNYVVEGETSATNVKGAYNP